MSTKTPTFSIVVTVAVTAEQVADQLCSAFEGGSNYWYKIEKFVKPEGEVKSFTRLSDGKIYRHIDYPLNEGGALMVSNAGAEADDEVKVCRLDLTAIKLGLAVMAAKYPAHFADVTGEGGDANTGDVFLQCCLFGEVVYG